MMKTGLPFALAGVVGWPVAHSRSPLLHAHWLKRYKVRGYYVPLAVKPQSLGQVLEMLPHMGFSGVNVTLPHKESALSLAKVVTERARLIGAANTLNFLPSGSFEADNSDGVGFLESLRDAQPLWDPTNGSALVLGAGGAARAVLWGLLEAGVREIRLTNRTRKRAEHLADVFGSSIMVVDWDEHIGAAHDVKTIVNTTSLGMLGQPALELDFHSADPTAIVMDVVYEPLVTPFLKGAAEAGLATVDGLGMLLHQAVPGFEGWFGLRPEVDQQLRSAIIDGSP